MIINEILSPRIRASCTHAGATKVTVFRKTAKNQEVICLQAGQSGLFSRARKTAPATIGPSGSKPSATQGHTSPGVSSYSKNTPGTPSATLSGPERRPRRLLRTVYRCRLVAPTMQSPHHLSAPLIATARLQRQCGACLQRIICAAYLRRTVCRGALSIFSGLSSSSSSSKISATRSSVIPPSV